MIIRSRRVVLPDGLRPAAVQVQEGRIAAIGSDFGAAPGERIIDAGDLVVMPGLVDTHVHVNEPGRTEWEGFASATRAAAAGGVTTVVDMPLNSIPPTTSAAGLEAKRLAATAAGCHVDVGFWGGVVPGNTRELETLAAQGVRGFKCFLSPSGVEEFEPVDEDHLREVLPMLASLGLPLLVHAEWPSLLQEPDGDSRRHDTWLASRPPVAELAAIARLVRLAGETGARVHIVHLATALALPVLQDGRAAGARVTVETCPHYLTFAAEEIPDGRPEFKCAPPIRRAFERERLWRALIEGAIDLVATDHSPAPPGLKRLDDGDVASAWGGIASLQLGLAAVWSGARTRGVSPDALAQWMAAAPARLAGLYPRKGVLAPGADADLVIWDPDAEILVNGEALCHRHPVTPYHGRSLRGRVKTTILRGHVVYDEGTCGAAALGRFL